MTRTAVITVVTVAIALLIASFGGASLGLRNEGVQFPDGTLQTTAAAPAGEPVHITEGCVLGGTDYSQECTLYTVGAEQQLVIESVGVQAYKLGAAEAVLPVLVTTFDGSLTGVSFEELVGGTFYPGIATSVRANRPGRVRLYADPGTDVLAHVHSTTNSGTGRQVAFTITGHLVDVSAP